jgi:hypothetical protein
MNARAQKSRSIVIWLIEKLRIGWFFHSQRWLAKVSPGLVGPSDLAEGQGPAILNRT